MIRSWWKKGLFFPSLLSFSLAPPLFHSPLSSSSSSSLLPCRLCGEKEFSSLIWKERKREEERIFFELKERKYCCTSFTLLSSHFKYTERGTETFSLLPHQKIEKREKRNYTTKEKETKRKQKQKEEEKETKEKEKEKEKKERLPKRIVSVVCGNCREILYRYHKNGKGSLVKCFLHRIQSDFTSGDMTCPNCKQQFAREKIIRGRMAHKIISGKARLG